MLLQLGKNIKSYRNCFVLLVILAGGIVQAFAQCPNPSFTLPDTVCAGEFITITNTSDSADFYEWDFCSGDFEGIPQAENLSNSYNFPNKFNIVKENGKYYGFVCEFGLDKIVRLDFGTNLADTTPVATTLYIQGGTLDGPTGIELRKEGNIWYAFVVNYNLNKLIRLDLDTNIENDTLTFNDLGSPGSLNKPMSLEIVKDSTDYFAIIANNGNNTISTVSFGDSLVNSPGGNNLGSVSGSAGIWGITVNKYCNQWTGFITNTGNSNIIRADWGSDLNAVPVYTTIANVGGTTGIDFAREKGSNYLFLNSRSTDDLYKLDFGGDISSTPSVQSMGDFGVLDDPRDLVVFNDSSKQTIFISSFITKELTRVDFNSSCGENTSVSDSVNFSGLSYSSGGVKYIQLLASDSAGNMEIYVDSIVVINNPDAGFTVTSACYPDITFFNDTSLNTDGTLNFWKWDLSGTVAFSQDTTFSFPDTGNYNVSLNVKNGFGCRDSIGKTITVYEKPVAGFSFTTGCERDTLVFTDTSSAGLDSIVSWLWDMGTGEALISSENLSYAYDTFGLFTVAHFIETDKGCRDTVLVSMNVDEKPDVSFNVSRACENDSTEFLNNTVFTSGSVTYDWDFGDSNASALSDPVHQYSDTGSYSVQLMVEGFNGCNDSLMKEVAISKKPSPAFNYSSGTICEGTEVSFTDQSSTTGSDTISNWFWQFGTGDSSVLQHPSYVFSYAGTFNTTLTVSVGSDCDSSVSQQIEVIEAPNAEFAWDDVCIGDSSFFYDSSYVPAGDSISSWQWSIGDSLFSEQNPSWLFDTIGFHPVSLTITASSGCVDSISGNTRVYDMPSVDFVTSVVCSDWATSFTDLSTSTDVILYDWLWNFDDPDSDTANTSIVQNPLHIFETPGNYNISLIATTVAGCSDTVTKLITVQQSPVAGFNFVAACKGLPVDFSDTTLGSVSDWLWDFGDGFTSNNQNPSHSYNAAGSFPVFLRVFDSFTGCFDTLTRGINIPNNPVADFFTDSLCEGVPVQFYNNSTVIDDTISSVEWQKMNKDTSDSFNPYFSFEEMGFYTVQLVAVSSSGCRDSIERSVEVHSKPTAAFAFSPEFGVNPLNVEFTDLSEDAVAWSWDFGDGGTGNAQHPSHVFEEKGEFEVKLIAENAFGCSDSSTKLLKVMQPVLDLAITKVVTKQSNGFLEISAELFNLGTRGIDNFEIGAEADGKSGIKESWSGFLPSGTGMRYEFNASYETLNGESPLFLCLNVLEVNGGQDDVPENNYNCTVSEKEFLVFDPYPNPASENVTIPFILPFSGNISIELYDKRGRLVKEMYSGEAKGGFAKIEFNISELGNSIYTISVNFNDNKINRKLVKFK